jgi:hypothetical protein
MAEMLCDPCQRRHGHKHNEKEARLNPRQCDATSAEEKEPPHANSNVPHQDVFTFAI